MQKRLEESQEAFKSNNPDIAIKSKITQRDKLELEKSNLNSQMRSLSLQADTRARLAIKKSEITKRRGEIDTM